MYHKGVIYPGKRILLLIGTHSGYIIGFYRDVLRVLKPEEAVDGGIMWWRDEDSQSLQVSVADEEIRMERYEVVTVQLSVTHRGGDRRSKKLWRNTESLKEKREIRGTRDEGRSVKFEDPVIRNTGYKCHTLLSEQICSATSYFRSVSSPLVSWATKRLSSFAWLPWRRPAPSDRWSVAQDECSVHDGGVTEFWVAFSSDMILISHSQTSG